MTLHDLNLYCDLYRYNEEKELLLTWTFASLQIGAGHSLIVQTAVGLFRQVVSFEGIENAHFQVLVRAQGRQAHIGALGKHVIQ